MQASVAVGWLYVCGEEEGWVGGDVAMNVLSITVLRIGQYWCEEGCGRAEGGGCLVKSVHATMLCWTCEWIEGSTPSPLASIWRI